jgi:hypothetical protein
MPITATRPRRAPARPDDRTGVAAVGDREDPEHQERRAHDLVDEAAAEAQ